MAKPPLSGIRVCDFTWVWAGPYCTLQLAHLGAEVIRIETKTRPCVTRMLPPWPDGVFNSLNKSGYFNQYNQGKKSLSLNFKHPEAKEAAWRLIEPLLPDKPRGVARVDDRRVINGIFYVLRTGSPWRDLPERYGPYTTVYNRFNRWAKSGVWLKIFETLAAKSPQSMQLIDSSIIRAHQHAAGGKKGARITPSVVLVED